MRWASSGRLGTGSTRDREPIGYVGPEEGILCFTQLLRVDLCPQEGNLRRQVHCIFDFVYDSEIVSRFFWNDERCIVEGAVPIHLINHKFIVDRTGTFFLEGLGCARLKKVGHAVGTF